MAVGKAVGLAIGTNAALHLEKGGSDAGWFSIGRDQIVDDVFDKDSFALTDQLIRVGATKQQEVVDNATMQKYASWSKLLDMRENQAMQGKQIDIPQKLRFRCDQRWTCT